MKTMIYYPNPTIVYLDSILHKQYKNIYSFVELCLLNAFFSYFHLFLRKVYSINIFMPSILQSIFIYFFIWEETLRSRTVFFNSAVNIHISFHQVHRILVIILTFFRLLINQQDAEHWIRISTEKIDQNEKTNLHFLVS